MKKLIKKFVEKFNDWFNWLFSAKVLDAINAGLPYEEVDRIARDD